MAYELRKRINLPIYLDGSYPSDSLKRAIRKSDIADMTLSEARSVRSEVSEAILVIERDLEVAKTLNALPPDHPKYHPINEVWATRAQRMRKCLLAILREASKRIGSERDSNYADYEKEADQINAANAMRHRRQRLQIQAFIDLVSDQLGEQAVDQMIRQAATIADDAIGSDTPTPECFFDQIG